MTNPPNNPPSIEELRTILREQAAGHREVARIRDLELAATRDESPRDTIAVFDGALLVQEATEAKRSDAPRLRAELDRCVGLARPVPSEEEWR